MQTELIPVVFRPLCGRIYDISVPSRQPDYKVLLPRLPSGYYDPRLEEKREIAQRIDETISPMDIAVVYSIRRLYKLYGDMPDEDTIYQEMSFVYSGVDRRDIRKSRKFLYSIVNDLVPIGHDWAAWCAKQQDEYDLSFDEMESIADETAFKVVFFRHGFADSVSNGASLIQLLAASVKPMIDYYDHYRTQSSVPTLSFSDISGGSETDGFDIPRWLSPEASTMSAEDQYILENEGDDMVEGAYELSQDTDTRVQEISGIVSGVRQELQQYPVRDIIHALSQLSVFEQSQLLIYFGYAFPGERVENISSTLGVPVVSTPFSSLLALSRELAVGGKGNPQKIDFPSMIALASDPDAVRESYISYKARRNSLFAVYEALQNVSWHNVSSDESIRTTLMTLQTIMHIDDRGHITSKRDIVNALSQALHIPLQEHALTHILTNVCLPVLRGESPDNRWVRKISEYSHHPPQVSSDDLDRWIRDAQEHGHPIIVSDIQGLSDKERVVLQALIDFPDVAYVEVARRLGMKKGSLSYHIQQIMRKIGIL